MLRSLKMERDVRTRSADRASGRSCRKHAATIPAFGGSETRSPAENAVGVGPTRASLCPCSIEHVERRKPRLPADAIEQVHGDAGIAGPQRVTQLADAPLLGLHLRDRVHGKRPRALEP